MKWPLKPARNGARRQRGGVSPFMFGLIIGMSVFSAYSLQTAKRELAELQKRNMDRARAESEDLARGLEFQILTESRETYSEDYSLDRARAGAALSTGQTRGQQAAMVAERREDDAPFNSPDRRVGFTTTDDTLVRARVGQSQNADDLMRLQDEKNTALAVANTGAVRQRQVLSSNRAMETLAEHVYSFYASNMRFPTSAEFDAFEEKLGIRDVWGQKFSYRRQEEGRATLEFTTPWNYTQNMILSLDQ